MLCRKCGFDNPAGMKFCGQCAQAIQLVCRTCQSDNPVDFKYCGQCGTHLVEASAASPTQKITDLKVGNFVDADKTTTLNHGIERRQLTVLFCDLIGSTKLADSLDPEELREVMQKYRGVCDIVIKRHQGYTAQYLGDGILAYFGYPHANEDDARRAVNAGVDLALGVNILNSRLDTEHNITLAIRVGIHTGLVVIGEHADMDQSALALGTTPNIAARLQDMAAPNHVVLSADTYKLVHHFFDCVSLGEHLLKGFSRPINMYQANSALDVNRWLTVYSKEKILPLIGREQESALMLDRLDQAVAGVGQAVLLNGEAGIGKSRLAQFIRERITDLPNMLIECWGTPQFQNSYLHCVITVLRRMWNLNEVHDNDGNVARVESALATLGLPLDKSIPLICDLLGLSIKNSQYAPLDIPPLERKQQTLNLLLTIIRALATQKIIVFIAEDLHWIDPTTLELLGKLIDQVPTMRIFVLLTYRMEFTPPWRPRAHLTQISINRLTRKQSGRMIRWVTKNKNLPVELFQQIIDKTDGIPFYIEEFTRMVLDSEFLIESHDHYQLKSPLAKLTIPITLQDSLMAKLDKLGPEKELAQISAIVGREFYHGVLRAVVKTKESTFSVQLSNLVYSELLYQRGLSPHASYMFRHALVHEAAYESLLRKTRIKYHSQIAKIIIEQFPEIASENPEIIAHHFACGGHHDQAIKFWINAGEMALTHCAVIDAITHLCAGLQSYAQLTQRQQKPYDELVLQTKLGIAYIMTRGYASPEVENCFSRAYALSRNIGESDNIFPVLCGLWEYYVARAELETAHDIAVQLESAAQNSQQQKLITEAKRALGSTLFWQGDLTNARRYLEEGIKAAPNKAALRKTLSPIQDPTVAGLSNYACLLWLMGYADQALIKAKLAVSIADDLSHPFSTVYAHFFCAITHQLRGDTSEVIRETNIVLDIANRHNFAFWQAMAKMLKSWANFQDGPHGPAIAQFEDAMNLYHTTGGRIALSYFQSLLAELYITANNPTKALHLINDAIEVAEKRGERFFITDLLRVKANALMALDKNNLNQAKTLLDDAMAMAKKQGAKATELRIAISLRSIGGLALEHKAQDIYIKNLLDNITEGQSCPDILTARKLVNKNNSVTVQASTLN